MRHFICDNCAKQQTLKFATNSLLVYAKNIETRKTFIRLIRETERAKNHVESKKTPGKFSFGRNNIWLCFFNIATLFCLTF